MTDITEIAVIPKDTALQVFTVDGMIEPYLGQIRVEIDSFVPDISSKKGREAIASFAYKIAKCKTQIDGVGKEQTDIQKELPKKIDAIRKKVRDTLDAWRDEVRKPLDEWEAAEERRQHWIKTQLDNFQSIATDHDGRPVDIYRSQFATLRQTVIDEDAYGEFFQIAQDLYQKAIVALEANIAVALKRKAEAEELEKLRAEKAERDRKEAEERAAKDKAEREAIIAKEAAEAAERKAKAEAEAAAKKAQDELLAAQRREESAKREAEEAKRRAEQAEKDAKEKAERDHKAKLAAEEEAARKREANKKHRAKINNAALAAFIENGFMEEDGKAIIKLIAEGSIPHISINY